jgi:hypothetical protein
MPTTKHYQRLTKDELIPRKYRIVTGLELAAFLVTQEAVIKHFKGAGIIEFIHNLDGNPIQGRYDLYDAAQAIFLYEREIRKNDKKNIAKQTELAKFHQIRARVERETLQNQIFFGNLFRKDDVVKEWNDTVLAVRSKLMTLPWVLATKILGRENFQEVVLIIQAELEKLMNDLTEIDDEKLDKILERDKKTSSIRNSLKAGQFDDPTDVRHNAPATRPIGGKII